MSAAHPVNSQQAGLWFIHQADPECAAYHLVFAAQVNSEAGAGIAAAKVLDELMAEHEALRVSFRPGEVGPIPWTDDDVPVDLRFEDAREVDPTVLPDRIRADSRLPFDLARPPLWRIHLYRTGEQTWVFALVMHHAAFDFWTLALLLGEARSRLAGTASPFELDGSAFSAYAEQQATFLESAKATAMLTSEAARLADAPPALDLYGDRARPPARSYAGGSVPLTLPVSVTEAVQQMARESSATPYMVLLTAYFVLLSRLSGQSDVLVGTPTSGRLQRQYRNAIGNFVNTVVVRGEITETSTYRELLAGTRERVLAAMQAQELPFPWLVRELAPPRDPSRTPLYQAGFAWDRLPFLTDMGDFFLLEPGPSTAMSIAGAEVSPYPIPQQEGQTDLWIEMGAERDGAYGGVLRYNSDIFGVGTAQELADTFVDVVGSLLADPDRPLAELVRGDDQQRARLQDWGHGPDRERPNATLPQLFRDQAVRTPNGIALDAGDESWNYTRLLTSVEEIATALRTAGVVAGDRVAVLADRGAPLVAALLGVLEAGGCYVPLDPHLPADRLTYMAEDSGVRLLLTQESVRSEWLPGLPVLRLDELAAGVSVPLVPQVPHPTESADLAYVLYTSGSTGRPKGVAIGHRALVNLLLAMLEGTGFEAADRLLAVTTVSFDIAGLELFMPLVAGGTVIVCDSETAADGVALGARIEDSGATWMQATPTSWRILREAGWAGHPRLNVLCGGEELPLELAEFLAPRVNRLHNVYGPTETTIWSTAGEVEPANGIDIGAPIANTQLHVLDPQGRPVEPGFPGELWIGGDGLARGYWDRPELTAERFVTGLPAAPQQRLYRTGDRTRWTYDGRLLHHGRLDNQVKLRGYRIELAEVETVLVGVEGVSAAVVVVRDDTLVGYLVAQPDVELIVATVKSAAAQLLPSYMVPNVFVVLDEFPLTANLKIDRNRLPAPVVTSSASFEKPRDATEIQLARMTSEILGVSDVGIHDNFSDLGVHSLFAFRLSAAIRHEWDVDVPISLLLRKGSIAELLRRVSRRRPRSGRGS